MSKPKTAPKVDETNFVQRFCRLHADAQLHLVADARAVARE